MPRAWSTVLQVQRTVLRVGVTVPSPDTPAPRITKRVSRRCVVGTAAPRHSFSGTMEPMKIRLVPNDTIRVGRVGGVAVGIHWGTVVMVLITAAILAQTTLPAQDPDASRWEHWVVGLMGATALFGSVLAHEMGHALAAIRSGVPVSGVSLWFMGGVARLERLAPTPGAEFAIAAAGPAANVVLAAFAGLLYLATASAWPLMGIMATWFGIMNLVLALTNLVPAAPLDGGRILSSVLWKWRGDPEWGRLQAARMGFIFGAALVGGGLWLIWDGRTQIGIWPIAVGLYLIWGALSEIRAAALRSRLQSITVGALATPYPPAVPDSTSVATLLDWLRDSPAAVGVTHWDHHPVGFITADMVRTLSEAEQSWTTTGSVMLPVDLCPAAWADESITTVTTRLDHRSPVLLRIYEPHHGQFIGTTSHAQMVAVVDPMGPYGEPNWWGQDSGFHQGQAQPRGLRNRVMAARAALSEYAFGSESLSR